VSVVGALSQETRLIVDKEKYSTMGLETLCRDTLDWRRKKNWKSFST